MTIPFLKTSRLVGRFVFLVLVLGTVNYSQTGTVTRVTIHAKSLENTVTKENPDREVSIYLPPGYTTNKTKRYPVIYFLHGIGDTDLAYTQGWSIPNSDEKVPFSSISTQMDEGIRRGKFGEMIVVLPNQRTKWFGSFYVNSSVTGNWEDFTVDELVGYIDKNYRTLATADQRGIAGHSMGGFGALAISMKHPDVFRVAYGLNPAIIDWAADLTINSPAFKTVLTAKSFQELGERAQKGDFYPAATVTVAQAFSPNPDKPPFYCDFPFELYNGELRPSEPAYTKWQAVSPINVVKKYRSNLLKLKGYRFDSGYEDEFLFIPYVSRRFSSELTNNGIPHVFEEYNGDHRNRLPGRNGRMITEVLPFFWDHFAD
ncbi:MAG: alpha/beta hydrolase-fold protein [Acidobacteriota bacterium]|nr:alpha/beta hydrolase-fold protein [Acidobacteriota bacterium]